MEGSTGFAVGEVGFGSVGKALTGSTAGFPLFSAISGSDSEVSEIPGGSLGGSESKPGGIESGESFPVGLSGLYGVKSVGAFLIRIKLSFHQTFFAKNNFELA